jgi:hypothetical protein
MTTLKIPLVLGFGTQARSGKDTAATFIKQERSHNLKISLINFADALRSEVNEACEDLIATGVAKDHREALKVLCHIWNVPHIENAEVDSVYPHGKQRPLLQAIGQGRREDDPDHWTNKWAHSVQSSFADVVIASDMRYPNEKQIIKELDGYTVKFTRLGFKGLTPEQAAHISENALNDAVLDYHIVVNDGDLPWLKQQALNLFDWLIKENA